MSKTYLTQVEKVKSLVSGIRSHYDMVKGRGITEQQLSEMAQMANEAESLNAEVERLRLETSQKVKEANEKLQKMREMWLPVKNKVKASFDSTKWLMFGIQDKR